MTSPASLTGTRAMSSIATLSRGRALLAVSLAVFLLGFAALEIRAQEEPTRLDELVVSDGRVQFFFFSAGQCIQISNTTINGVTYTIHSSYWQRRSGVGSPWEEIPGTQETGQVCSLSPDSAGEYRLVADITIGDERGLYSSNILTKTGTDPEPAGLAPADQAAFDDLAVGKQILAPGVGSVIFLSPGRIREFDQGESYDGDYQYVNTGENMGTLTYTYDVTGNNPNVEKSVVEFTFTSITAGTFVHTYTESGSPPETLRGSFEFVDAPAEPVVEGDRAVLEEFYDATNGANWSSSTNWGSSRPLGEWYGVVTNPNGRVTQLSLEDNQLSGSIPSSLGNLSNLEYLSLAVNQLSGSIPSSLGNLSNLEYLALAVNPLSGSIPSSLGNLSNLVNLHLTFNQLSGSIPSNLGNLSNLEYLDLWENQLSGSIPSSLGNLSNLEALDLSFNQLTGSIPSSLGNLSNLEKLWLRENQLSGSIPISLGNLSNLQVLSLSAGNDELCAPNDEAFQAWLNSIGELRWTGPTCPADAVQPKPADEVQATVEAAVEAGGGLRAGGPPVTIDMSTLFSFGAGVTADTDYTAQSSDPALVAAETTDERLVLTPGNSLPAEASSSLVVGAADGDPARATITVTAVRAGEMAEVKFTVEVEAAPSEVPAAPLLAQLLLALLLLGCGARFYRR